MEGVFVFNERTTVLRRNEMSAAKSKPQWYHFKDFC